MAHPRYDFDLQPASFDTAEEERLHRKRVCALGYRMFGILGYGQLGDGHISARDPEQTDHFWLLPFGMTFKEALPPLRSPTALRMAAMVSRSPCANIVSQPVTGS